MAHGIFRVYNVVIASGTSLSSEVDLGRTFTRVYVDPTGANAEVRFQAASTSGGTYRQVYFPGLGTTSTVQANIWKIASSVSGGIQEAPAGLQYIKVETTAAVANGATLKLICSD